MPDNDILVETPAWLLTPHEHFKIALDESSMQEYIRNPQVYSIPDAVEYCNQIILWRNNFTPVIDLSLILGGEPLDANHLAIVGYQEYAEQKPKHLAIKLISEVESVKVVDDAACSWPKEYPIEIQPIVESLFMNGDELISVINIADLCNEGYRDYLAKIAELLSKKAKSKKS